MRKSALASIVFLVLGSVSARAQDPFNVAVPVDKLSSIFTQLYGDQGLIVDSLTALPTGQTHSAHFNSAFQAEFTQFGVALTSQLASVPLPSPASGFTYEFDSDLGVFERTSQSFGPILAERSETIGGGRFTFGFTFQNFTFDTIEGLDVDNVPAVFTHDSAELRGGREDLVTTVNSIDAQVNQFTAFISYGLTDRLDLSLAIPVVSTDLTVISAATVRRIGTADPQVHFFRDLNDNIGDHRTFTAFGSASGLGDLTLRLKGRLGGSAALGMDVRVPTGDEENLLGVGAPGVRPFVVLSRSSRAFSPHLNVGYLWNGSSVLAGNPATGETADLPDQVTYVLGADFGVSQRFTFVLDVIGNYLIDAPRLQQSTFLALDGRSTFPTISFENESYNLLSGAVGFKLNVVESLLVDVNLLFNLDNNGLRDKITPLVGFEYAF
ncbi:MAG: hypothetical protein ACRD3V_23345 [Vicinamibacteria bacterium]